MTAITPEMSYLAKSQAAAAEAGGLDHTNPQYTELLIVARLLAEIASAEALTRIADHFDWARTRGRVG